MIKRFSKILVLTLSIGSCNEFKTETEKYFESTFNLISENSVKKHEINWDELEQEVRDSIKTFDSSRDVQFGIAYTLKLINDGHSSLFVVPTKQKNTSNTDVKENNSKVELPKILTKVVDNDIGYIKLNGFPIVNDSLRNSYTFQIRKLLLELDKTNILSGWIIDLSENSGGEMSSESLGLAPLFEKPLIGIVKNNKNEFKKIYCTNNKFKFGDTVVNELPLDSDLRNSNKKTAILISNKTASSGEFLALAFKFQDKAKTFGQKTNGKTSITRLHMLRDDAILSLTEAYYCNPEKTLIADKLYPDIECSNKESIGKAIKWIKNAL